MLGEQLCWVTQSLLIALGIQVRCLYDSMPCLADPHIYSKVMLFTEALEPLYMI